jgi:hypothetical protein
MYDIMQLILLHNIIIKVNCNNYLLHNDNFCASIDTRR